MTSRRVILPALLAGPLTAAILLFVFPLADMVRRSISDGAAGYGRFVGDTYYLSALAVTLGTALLVTAITLVASCPLALAYWRAAPRWKSALTVLLLSPFYANVVVKLFGWMVLLPSTLRDSYWAIVIVDVHRAMPFMVLMLAAALARIDMEIVESARTCGAGEGRVFRTVILPLMVPGAVGGGMLVFSLTVASFVVPLVAGGPAGRLFLTVLMYQQITVAQDWAFAAVIGAVLLATSTAAIAAASLMIRRAALGRALTEGFRG